jgi:hypothetical protein
LVIVRLGTGFEVPRAFFEVDNDDDVSEDVEAAVEVALEVPLDVIIDTDAVYQKRV